MSVNISYRDFLYLQVLRDLSPKYRIPWVGLVWTLGQPLLSSLAVTTFVGPRLTERLVTQQYFFYCWIGFSVWFFFSQSVQAACSSLTQKTKLVRSSPIPKVYLLASSVIAGLLEHSLNLILILIVAVPVSGPVITFKTPFLIVLAFLIIALFALGLAFWVSSLCLLFQDVKYLISFLLQLVFLCSPVLYSPNIKNLKAALYYSNPIALSMKLIRASLGVSSGFSGFEIILGLFITLFFLVSGYLFFQSKSKVFAELA